MISSEIDDIDGTTQGTRLISDLLQIEPSEYVIIYEFIVHSPVSRLGYDDPLAILNHDFFQLLDLKSIYDQCAIPSYIPPDPEFVSPYLDDSISYDLLDLSKCLNFKDFLKENQDIFEGF